MGNRGGDELQKSETTPMKAKRSCGGTTAKLMICAGTKTPQLRIRVGTYACVERQHSSEKVRRRKVRARRTDCMRLTASPNPFPSRMAIDVKNQPTATTHFVSTAFQCMDSETYEAP